MIANCPTWEGGAKPSYGTQQRKPGPRRDRLKHRRDPGDYRRKDGRWHMVVRRGEDGRLGWIGPVVAIVGQGISAGMQYRQEQEAKKEAEKARKFAARQAERAAALERERMALERAQMRLQASPPSPDSRGGTVPGKPGFAGIQTKYLLGGAGVLTLIGAFLFLRRGRRGRRR